MCPHHPSRFRSHLVTALALAAGALAWSAPASAANVRLGEEIVCTPGHGLHLDQGPDGSLTIHFRPAHVGAAQHLPAPGECAFVHRPTNRYDGTVLVVHARHFTRYELDCVVDAIHQGKSFSVQAHNVSGRYQNVTRYNASSPYTQPTYAVP